MNYHSGMRFQRGRGLGSIFSGLMRGFAPLARMGLNAGKRFIQSDLVKGIANTALDHGKKAVLGMAADLVEGKNVKDAAQAQLNEAKKDIATQLRGGGRKRKKKSVKNIRNLKKLKFDLLDDGI
jgi:hypothetical protein